MMSSIQYTIGIISHYLSNI